MLDLSLRLKRASELSGVVITRDRLIAALEAATNGNHNERIFVASAKGVRFGEQVAVAIAAGSAGYRIGMVLDPHITCESYLALSDRDAGIFARVIKSRETLKHYCEEHPTSPLQDASVAVQRGINPTGDPAASPGNVDSAHGTPDSQTGAVVHGDDASLASLVRRDLYGCWSPPAGLSAAKNLVVTVTFSLNRDGSLSGTPQVKPTASSPLFQAAAESALRAIRKCMPLKLPSDQYESWKEIEVSFDPRMLQ